MANVVRKMYQSLGSYRLLYVLSALEMIVIFSYFLYAHLYGGSDRFSYYAAYDVIMSGNIDEVRTPLYPLIVGSLKTLFGFSISRILVFILQALIFLFSINWFGKTLDNIIPNKRIGYWFTAVYALYPGILTYSCYLLTETLAITLTTALIYLIAEAYYHNSYKKAAFSGLVCLALWLLRPANIYVTFIMLVFWGILLVSRGDKLKKTVVCGLCTTLVSLAGIGIYSMMFNKEYHKMGLTCVSTWNNYWMIRESGVMDTGLVEDQDIKVKIDSIIGAHDYERPYDDKYWRELMQMHKELGLYEFDHFVNQQIKEHPKELMAFLLKDRLDSMLKYDCVFTASGPYGLPFPIRFMTKIIRVNIGMAFLIFLLSMAVLIFTDIKKRKISYFMWLLFSFFAACYFTIWVGAMAEYDRLASPIYSVFLAISGWLLNMLMYFAADDKK